MAAAAVEVVEAEAGEVIVTIDILAAFQSMCTSDQSSFLF